MATIKKQGNGYKITVSHGYDINGKQLRDHMTWVPDPCMTAKQIEKELNRQAVLFEEKVRCAGTNNGNIRLVDFTDLFLKQHAIPNLKAKTAYNYETKMAYINQALGHIKLKDLKPGHIASFLANMQEEGMRERCTAKCKINIDQWICENQYTAVRLAKESGLSIGTIKQVRRQNPISVDCARRLSTFLGYKYCDIFESVHDDIPLKPGTIYTYARVLSAVLSKAVSWEYIDRNPVERVDLPSIAGRKAVYLDEPDARRLLEILSDEPIRWRVLVTFDLMSGMRRAELAGLCWSDIDFESGTVTVRRTANYIPKKGIYIDTPKTETSNRVLKISESAISMLQNYKMWQDQQRAKLGDAWQGREDRVFTTDGGKALSPDSISQHFHAFISRTGLPKITLHSLRHTYASLMISDSIPLVVVASQLGHAQTSTTANIYGHVISAAETRALQVFDRFNDLIQADGKSE